MELNSINEQVQEIEKAQFVSGQDIHLPDPLIILLERRRFILLVTISAAILAVFTVLLIPSRYTAEAVVLPPSQNSTTSSALLSQLGGPGSLASVAGTSLGIKTPGDLYVSLFRSRTLEDSVIQRFGLMARYRKKRISDTRKAFENRSTVVLGSKDGLIRISVTDRDPNFAEEMANGYIDEFRKFSANLAITEASQRRIFFQQQLLEANQNLATAEEAMKYTEETTGVLQIDSQARSLIESAAALRGQITAKEVQLQGMRSYATEENPQMIIAEQQLDALKAQLGKLAGSDSNASSDIILPKSNIPQAGMEYLIKLRDVRYYETIEELIAKQFEMAKLDEAREGSVMQLVDGAVPPDKRSFPQRTIIIIVAILLGFFVACGWCLIAEGLQRLNINPEKNQRLDALRATFH